MQWIRQTAFGGHTPGSGTIVQSGSASSERAHCCEHEARAVDDVAIEMTAMKA